MKMFIQRKKSYEVKDHSLDMSQRSPSPRVSSHLTEKKHDNFLKKSSRNYLKFIYSLLRKRRNGGDIDDDSTVLDESLDLSLPRKGRISSDLRLSLEKAQGEDRVNEIQFFLREIHTQVCQDYERHQSGCNNNQSRKRVRQVSSNRVRFDLSFQGPHVHSQKKIKPVGILLTASP